MRDWYPPSMSFTVGYVKWLLGFLPYLMGGFYPRDPRETGYTDAPGKRHISPHAPFERAVIIGAELMVRLGRCGTDSLLAQACYTDGKTDKEIAKQHHVDQDDVSWRINRAIRYCASGPVRRWHSSYIDRHDHVCRPQTYREFCEERK